MSFKTIKQNKFLFGVSDNLDYLQDDFEILFDSEAKVFTNLDLNKDEKDSLEYYFAIKLYDKIGATYEEIENKNRDSKRFNLGEKIYKKLKSNTLVYIKRPEDI